MARPVALIALLVLNGLVALSVASCAGLSASGSASTSAPVATRPGAAGGASPAAAAGFGGSAAGVQSAVERGGYVCVARAAVAGFGHVECPKAGVADVDIYARSDGTVAGLDAYAPGTAMTADAILAVLGPALDAAAGPGTSADIATAVRAAGAPAIGTTTVLPGRGLSVMIHGYANGGLASVAVLAPDLAAVWGRPPAPSPSAS